MKKTNFLLLIFIFSCSTLIFAQDKKNENDEKNGIENINEQPNVNSAERETDEIRVIRFNPVLLIDWEESDADWEKLLENEM